jgi:hypothetical protein
MPIHIWTNWAISATNSATLWPAVLFVSEDTRINYTAGAKAVSVLLPHKAGRRRYRLDGGMAFREKDALALIDWVH